MYPRFSIAPINWTNDDDPSLGGTIPLGECLTEMREAGYEGCELGNKFPKDQTALRKCLQRYGLTLTTDWLGTTFTLPETYKESLTQFRKRVQFLAPFGVHALKVCEVGNSIQQTNAPIFSTRVTFTSAQWRALVQGLREASRIAHDHGMYIAYHHHLGTGIENVQAITRLMESVDEDTISLLPDTGHLYAAGIEPLYIFKRYASRIKYVHLKDVRHNVMSHARAFNMSFMEAIRAGLFTVPGDGNIDFAPIFSLLKHINFSGWLVVEAEQDPKKSPPLLFARRARNFLRANFSC